MIRKRKEKDNDAIIDIWYESSNQAHPFLETVYVEKVKNDLKNIFIPKTETWVYEENEFVVGFISMLFNEIGGLFVLPNSQSQGIGTKLIDFIKGFHTELEVEVFEKNYIGRAFYEKYGFVIIKKYFHTESKNEMLRMKCCI
jgi:putative acetyltransferase